MNNDKLVENIVIAAGVVILAPVVIGAVTAVVGGTAGIINKVQFNRRIKKGLKDGSIIEINGKYYEVKVEEA